MDIISFSGGKDSTAVLLKLNENNELENKIILHISMQEWEHPEMLEHIKKVEKYINKEIIKINAFENGPTKKMLDHVVNKQDKTTQNGYWWCGKSRWGTTYKMQAINKFYKRFDEVVEYIGYAIDEKAPSRQAKIKQYKNGELKNIVYPLVDMNMTEKDALKYCYSKGFDWGGLYDMYDRVSCWCCQNNNLKELERMYKYEPKKWEKLKELDKQVEKRVIEKYGEYLPEYRYKKKYTFDELEQRFEMFKNQIDMFNIIDKE